MWDYNRRQAEKMKLLQAKCEDYERNEQAQKQESEAERQRLEAEKQEVKLLWTSISFEFGKSHSPFSSVGSEAEVQNFFQGWNQLWFNCLNQSIDFTGLTQI